MSSTNEYDLRSPFNIEQHNKHYINYFEAIMLTDGTVVYAVPSHQEKLIEIAQEIFHWTRDDVNDNCPIEYYEDFVQWLCNITECAALWNNMMIPPKFMGKPSLSIGQVEMMYKLMDAKIWKPDTRLVSLKQLGL